MLEPIVMFNLPLPRNIDSAEDANPRASLPAARRFLRQIQSVCSEGLETRNPLLTAFAVDVLIHHCGGQLSLRQRLEKIQAGPRDRSLLRERAAQE
jgi:hypothetical protein